MSPVELEQPHSYALCLKEEQNHMDYLKRQIKSILKAHFPPKSSFLTQGQSRPTSTRGLDQNYLKILGTFFIKSGIIGALVFS